MPCNGKEDLVRMQIFWQKKVGCNGLKVKLCRFAVTHLFVNIGRSFWVARTPSTGL